MPSDLDIGGGIGKGIQLAGTGFAVGGPIGAAIGGGVGLVSGLFGGRQRRRTERRLRRRNERLLAMLQGNVDRLEGQRASDTAGFQTGRAALEETVSRQAQRDEGQAAARGLSGSSFEIAQSANRARALGRGTAGLFATSEAELRADRRAALARLLAGHSLAGQTDLALLSSANQREQQSGAALGGAFEASGTAGLFGRTSGVSESVAPATEPFIDSIPQGIPVESPAFFFG